MHTVKHIVSGCNTFLIKVHRYVSLKQSCVSAKIKALLDIYWLVNPVILVVHLRKKIYYFHKISNIREIIEVQIFGFSKSISLNQLSLFILCNI